MTDASRVDAMLDERRAAAEREAEKRLSEIHKILPEIEKIDRELAGTKGKIISAILAGPDKVREKMTILEAENHALQAKRAAVLTEAGYPGDYTEPQYFCSACKDTGYVDGKLCICKRRALILAGYESSGIGSLMKTQSFETFSLEYYHGDALENAKRALLTMREYADGFSGDGDGNILLVGGTGLGKTHLSTAVSVRVIDRGYNVKYVTAQELFADFERKQFGNRADGDGTEDYFECDLLVIDDLGTEMTNTFTMSCLYNVINSRINRGKSMIISTNLSSAELRRRYLDRITSRLFGEFTALVLTGSDIRAEKLKK